MSWNPAPVLTWEAELYFSAYCSSSVYKLSCACSRNPLLHIHHPFQKWVGERRRAKRMWLLWVLFWNGPHRQSRSSGPLHCAFTLQSCQSPWRLFWERELAASQQYCGFIKLTYNRSVAHKEIMTFYVCKAYSRWTRNESEKAGRKHGRSAQELGFGSRSCLAPVWKALILNPLNGWFHPPPPPRNFVGNCRYPMTWAWYSCHKEQWQMGREVGFKDLSVGLSCAVN